MNGFLKSVSVLVMAAMSPGPFVFGDQLRLGLQPMLHLTSGLRALVDITEVGSAGHFLRRWHKFSFGPAWDRIRDGRRLWFAGRGLAPEERKIILFHP